MKFIESNYKMIIVVGVSIVVQIAVVIMLLSTDSKEKKEIDSTIAKQDTNIMMDSEGEMDSIDQAKSNLIRSRVEDSEIIEGEDADADVKVASQVGKLDVHVGYNPQQNAEAKSSGQTMSRPKSPSQITSKTDNKTSTTNKKPSNTSNKKPVKNKKPNNKIPAKKNDKVDDSEKLKKTIIGKWKSVNDSEGRKSDMYWEFFDDGSYQNYDDERSIVFNGKYGVNSSDIINIDQDNVYITATGSTRNQKEVFSVGIKLKGKDGFSVTDIEHFDFTNYKKVK